MLDIQILPPDDATPLPDLAFRWDLLCNEIDLADSSKSLFSNLQKHYTNSKRMYHNFSHIHAMLKICEQHQSDIENYRVLRLAVWYHDIIYWATRKDNEAKSAEYALEALSNSDLSAVELEQIKQLIISTKSHGILIDNFDNRLLLDADLGVLAASREAYMRYTHAIREEYKLYPDFLYKKGRKKVLQHFLERAQIYFTETFQAQHESDARENLTWEIQTLS